MKNTTSKKASTKKTHFTFYIDPNLKERLKNAVYWMSGPPHRLNLTNFLGPVVENAVRELEEKYNDGKPFKKRLADFVGGRPMK